MIQAQSKEDELMMKGMLIADSLQIDNIYRMSLPQVKSWVSSQNGSVADAEDLFQEALIALYKRLGQGDFNLTCKLSSYIQIICRNLWFSKLKKKDSENKYIHEQNHDELDDGMLDLLEQNDKRKLFRQHFDLLEKGCQQILSLFFDKVSFKEISEKLNFSLPYVKKRKFLCKKKLIESIQNDPLYKELAE